MNHQVNQWRHQRPFQGNNNNNNNICPTCSNSHFPFCPSFDQNLRFPTPQNQPFIRHEIDASRSPTTAHRRPVFVDSRIGGNGIIDGGFGNYERSDDDDRSRKRVRVGEIRDLGSYGNGHVESNGSYGRIVGEEERRLKLIHEHGGVFAGQQAHPAQNGGEWGVHQRPHHVVNNMANMVWNGSGSASMHPGYGVSGISVGPAGQSNFSVPHRFASPPYNMQESWNMQGRYLRGQGGMNAVPQNINQLQPVPPLPLSPPPPIPMEPPRPLPYEHKNPYQLSPVPSSVFPAHLSSSPGAISPSFPSVSKEYHPAPPFMHNRMRFPNSAGHVLQEHHAVRPTMPNQYGREEQSVMSKQWKTDKPKVIDAVHLFKQPHRATRLDHFVIILRGLPGSGKSYFAKMLRDIEVENGGEAPRIHSMDEYFMTEVEKPEEYENSKSASSSRGKKTTMKKVMEYCYEPEMEEVYRSSMLKAFKKSLEVGKFTFIIVDDRNLRVAHFAQFWAIAKSFGYEVYLLEAPYKDPAGCAARNVHNFTQDDIEKMAEEWEEAPSMYLKLDMKSLSHGDNLKESSIEEVDMDMEDEADSDQPDTHGGASDGTGPSITNSTNANEKQEDDSEVADGESLDTAKELGRSKWSNDEDEEDVQLKYNGKRNTNELSNSAKSYGKRVKSIRWGDEEKDTGFSIGAAKRVAESPVIGPGPGYNSTTNPVQTEYPISSIHRSGNKKTAFQERLRAEHESFKDVFAKRKQKLGFALHDE